MNGFDIKENPKANGSGHSRVLRTLLTSNLLFLHSALRLRVSEIFTHELLNENTAGIAAPESTRVTQAEKDPRSYRLVEGPNLCFCQESCDEN